MNSNHLKPQKNISLIIIICLTVLSGLTSTIEAGNPPTAPSEPLIFYQMSAKAIGQCLSDTHRRKNTLKADSLLQAIITHKSTLNNRLNWIHAHQFTQEQKITYLDKVFTLSKREDHKEAMAWVHVNKGLSYKVTQDYEKCIMNTLAAKALYTELNDTQGLGIIHYIYGCLYEESNLHEKAISEFTKASFNLNETNPYNYERLFINHNHLGRNYAKIERYDKALECLHRSRHIYLSHIPQKETKPALAYVYALYANIYERMGQTHQAKIYIDSALHYVPTEQDNLKAEFYHLSSQISVKRKEFKQAKKEALLAHAILSGSSKFSLSKRPEISKNLSDIYYNLQRFDSAYIYRAEYSNLKDIVDKKGLKIGSLLSISEDQQLQAEAFSYKLKRRFIIILLILISTACALSIYIYQANKLKKANIKLVRNALKDTEENYPNKNKKQEHAEGSMQQLIKDLNQLYSDPKTYLNDNLTLHDVATRLGTNTSYLSKAINTVHRVNFNTYVNLYKINHAIQLIKDGRAELLTVEAIATECGFNNRVRFSTVFKNIIGVSPSFFIKNYKQLDHAIPLLSTIKERCR